MGIVLTLIAVALGLIIVAVLVESLFSLLAIGIVVLVLALIVGALRSRRGRPRTRR